MRDAAETKCQPIAAMLESPSLVPFLSNPHFGGMRKKRRISFFRSPEQCASHLCIQRMETLNLFRPDKVDSGESEFLVNVELDLHRVADKVNCQNQLMISK